MQCILSKRLDMGLRRFGRSSLLLCAAAAIASIASTMQGGAASADVPSAQNSDEIVSIRRLTEEQYRRSISDIFGADIKISGRLQPDARRDGLIAIGTTRTSINTSGLAMYDAAAQEIAAQIIDPSHRGALIACEPADTKSADDNCARRFLIRAGRFLYRRPLQPSEADKFVKLARMGAESRKDFFEGISTSLVAMLDSAPFLFRTERAVRSNGELILDSYSIASRLSFMLWNAAPDDQLLDAAERGELATDAGLAKQVDRLLASPRLEAGTRAFFSDMLALSDLDSLQKDPQIYPRFNSRIALDAREQTLRTIVDVLVRRNEDYGTLFTTRRTFLSRSLGVLYGLPVTSRAGWEAHEFAADDPRVGILAQPAFLMGHSHPGRSSPTLRGKAVRELLLCQQVPAPPANVDFAIVQNVKDPRFATARQRLSAHNSEAMCAGCHKLMDPLGLAMENFDGGAGMRTAENGVPIDASGELGVHKFSSMEGLGKAMASDPSTGQCLVSRAYSYALGRSPDDEPLIKAVGETQGALPSDLKLRAVFRAVALSSEFRKMLAAGGAAMARADQVRKTTESSNGS
ncbi:DUF1592 domain-containing protein [Novosphingobium sp. G106]|uniref:DUF1592 domain-containing protein n=1 Tax=Novosphingobium sp. G106 TaxID=2849500 RepID=UPI001C2CF95A|nr:DUF1592 domain-containing protein [Novosphingobium sp. G106]MBV1687786.1 DUF1592 domain-containing protein [Novosphingobium sp. G106]